MNIAENRQVKTPGLITPDELYKRYGGTIGKGSIYEALKANKIRHLKVGRKILILESEVEQWPLREAEVTQ
jgi:excisionase family DNA binding protein